MAPIRPIVKPKPTTPKKTLLATAETSFGSDFPTSKKDKRTIKHSAFVSKIEKSHKKPLKRRRPSEKLVANLHSLADALPDAGDEAPLTDSQVNIIKHKSLKHRPGAMKRKEKIDKMERDRFAKNLAQMASGLESTASIVTPNSTDAGAAAPPPSSNRWAALRNFISQTMDHNPEFKK